MFFHAFVPLLVAEDDESDFDVGNDVVGVQEYFEADDNWCGGCNWDLFWI